MNTLIIIPTYNEAQNIKKLIDKIFDTIPQLSILVVDDNSLDGTKEEVLELQKKFPNLYLITRPAKLGLASAYIEGFKFGLGNNFDVFIQMDADFSHNPKYLPAMLEELRTFDVVIASRNVKNGGVQGWSKLRNFISKGGSFYSKLILNCPIKDLTGGFNGWRKDILLKIDLDKIISKGYGFQIELKYKAFKNGAKIKEIPFIFEDRIYGKSKMNKSIFFEALFNVIKIRF